MNEQRQLEQNQLLDLVRKTRKQSPDYVRMTNYLTARNAYPVIDYQDLGPNTLGQFGFPGLLPSSLPASGKLELSRQAYATPNTLTHEMTHAMERQFTKQYEEEKKKHGRTKFTDAYEKMRENPEYWRFQEGRYPLEQLAKKLDPTWVEKAGEYRTSTAELPAWGLGNMQGSKKWERGGSHVDPTMATEALILLDLATRKK